MQKTIWVQRRKDLRSTNWHIINQNFKDIYFMTLCNVQMSLDENVKYENDEDYKWQFGHYFLPDKICNKCQKILDNQRNKVSA